MSNERFNLTAGNLSKLDFKLLYISTSKYEGDWQSFPHVHHFSELFYVTSGQGYFLAGSEQLTVTENDLVIVNPHVEHTEKSMDARPLEYIVFGIEGLTFDFGEKFSGLGFGCCNLSSDKNRILNFSQIMLQEILDKKPGYDLVCHDLLEVLLIHIIRARRLSVVGDNAAKIPKECAIARRYLDTHYSQNITLDSLAEATHTNKYYLSHIFRDCFGRSPINYLTQKRLEVSRELLSSTDHSIAQIASSAGFASQSYFSQTFKRLTGMSPNQYRRQHGLRG